MNKKRVIMMFSALTLVSSHTLADTQAPGKLSIDRDGVKVWTFKQIWRGRVSDGHRSFC
jgi:hypothetical protein